jgi:hypothetical protein
MRRWTLFITVFATMLLMEGALLLAASAGEWLRPFMAALLVTCTAAGWLGGRSATVLRPLLPVWAGAFTATLLAMAVFVLTGAALQSGSGPASAAIALFSSLIYPPVLAVVGAAGATPGRLGGRAD